MELPSIKAIDKVSVARICSGQVITDLATAVKELVENSLSESGPSSLVSPRHRDTMLIMDESILKKDARAKHVEVKLKEFGLDLIEVSDNGSGVSPSNYEGLALKYHTSKLSTFSDLTGVTSFGFRGEALSSLCELAGSLSVTTRTRGESVGVKLTYGRDGKLLSKETAPRQVGTTITITNMFEPLPVRRGEFRRNIKKQYNRLLRGMQAYALISLGVRITVTNTKAKGGKQTLIGTQYNNKMGDNVTNVFGAKFLSTLVPFDLSLDGGEDGDDDASATLPASGNEKNYPNVATAKKERRILGMVSKAGVGVGRADNDRQFLYLNGRPVDLPKFTRAVSEVWRAYEMKQKPAFILDVRLPPGNFDVNVTPDKREIFMTDEADVIDRMKKAMHELWAPSRYTIPVNEGQLVQARLTDGAFTVTDAAMKASPPPTLVSGTRVNLASPIGLEELTATKIITPDSDGLLPVSGKKSNSRSREEAIGIDVANVRNAAEGRIGIDSTKRDVYSSEGGDRQETADEAIALGDGSAVASGLHRRPLNRSASQKRRRMDDDEEGDESLDTSTKASEMEADDDIQAERRRSSPRSEGIPAHAADGSTAGREKIIDITMAAASERTTSSFAGTANGLSNTRGQAGAAPHASLDFSLPRILSGCRKASRAKRKRDERNASAYSFSGKLSGRASAEDQDSKAAARAFSRVLHKEHFTQMRVVGQFNLGFMICLLGSDLFILDQHACDEKYNFEVLQKTTTIHQQPLVRPLPLETSASEEMTIIDNLAIFEKNGFRFTVDESGPTTKKLKITAVPFSKGTQFGVDDVHELASIVADNNKSGEMVRLPKARAMFASRACRSSIMIGKALDRGQMSRVVAKMATIEQPWNCPHGRPTMRHLADVSKSLRAAAGLDALLEA